jgi:hypothetical protein
MSGMAGFLNWLAYAVLANPIVVLLLIALGPVVTVAFGVGASIAVIGTVIGLMLAVTADEILLTLGLFGLGLWLVAFGLVIFGRPRRAR